MLTKSFPWDKLFKGPLMRVFGTDAEVISIINYMYN